MTFLCQLAKIRTFIMPIILKIPIFVPVCIKIPFMFQIYICIQGLSQICILPWVESGIRHGIFKTLFKMMVPEKYEFE